MAFNLGKLKLGTVPEKKAEPNVESIQEPTPPTPAPTKPAGIRLGGLRLGSPAPVPVGDVVGGGVSVPIPESTIARANGTPEGFQALLDRLDDLMIEGQGVSALTLDTTRHYVKDIYMELAKFPEFDPIFKDRDMHNVMAFVQRSTIQAKEVIVKKQTKAATSAAKKALNADFGDFGSFTDSAAKPITTQIAAAAAVGNAMAQLQSIDLSGIEGKERGKK